MVKPNKFEKAILDAAKKAQEFHKKMADGPYLSYSHESFLQNFIAMNMFKNTGHYVFVDPSPKKILEWYPSAGKKPPKNLNLRERFDLVFWLKSEDRVKAIVEIKVTWGKKPVMDDVHKVSEYLTKDGRGIPGYVLYYTDKRRNDRWKGNDIKFIRKRFYEVDKEIKEGIGRNKQNVGMRHRPADYTYDPKDDDPWGFALFRC